MTETAFTDKLNILADLLATYKNDPEFTDFFDYNDVGLPLAYVVANGLATLQPKGLTFIDETWNLFLASLEISDNGFENLDDVLAYAETQIGE